MSFTLAPIAQALRRKWMCSLCVAASLSDPGLAGAEVRREPTEQSSPPEVAPAPFEYGAPLKWDPKWKSFSTLDYGLSIGVGALGLAALVFGPDRDTALRQRPAFDDRARKVLRASTPRGRLWARDASDVLVTLLASYPIAVDGLINAAWYRRSPEVAEQMILMNLEANVISAGVTSVFKAMVRRERPYGEDCGGEIDGETSDCLGVDRFYSHFSGHASVSFVAASLTCVHHANLPLWGGASWWLPCAGGYAAAATTATLRVVGDRHYLSDVVVGAFSGALAGFLVPWLHYNSSNSSRSDSWLHHYQVGFVPGGQSLTVTGKF